MNHYDKDRDNVALGKWYTDHVSAMTREGLHAKSDIASELAFRDKQIAERDETIRKLRDPVAVHVAMLRGEIAVPPLAEAADRIAALEAEKAERERQEPVAWAWDDALGCMHAHCGSRRPIWVDGECSDAKRAETSLRPLYAEPPVPRVDPDWLANVIRRADPRMSMTSDELAEKIAEAINGRAK